MATTKLSEENIKLVCEELGLEPTVVETIIYKARQKDEQEKVPTEKTKREKKDWMVVINDPEGKVSDDLQVWIIQKSTYIEKESGALLKWGDLDVSARLKACTKSMKDNPKLMKRLGSIDSLSDIFEFLPGKTGKEEGIMVKTKEPVALVRVNGSDIIA